MTNKDKYYYFIRRAISAPNNNPQYRYFVNSNEQILMMKKSIDVELMDYFDYRELPKLSYSEKKEFLKTFVANLNFREEALIVLEDFNESSEFESLSKEFKKIDFDIALDFEFESAKFLDSNIEKIYHAYEVNEDMHIKFLT